MSQAAGPGPIAPARAHPDTRAMRHVYLNQAASSFPKPREVVEAVLGWFDAPPVDAGRGGDPAADPIARCRRELAALLGVDRPEHVTLLPSATHAINLVIGALVGPGSHVVASTLEHNSVLRPIAHRVRDLGVSVTLLEPDAGGLIHARSLGAEIRATTTLVTLTHASNVTGSVQPIRAVAEVAAAAGVPLLIDASQSVGAVPIDYRGLPGRVFLAFSGHKGLLGPPGVGGLVVPDDALPQTIVGGTGVRSEDTHHPAELPLRHEAGTPNLPGIAGLLAGTRLVRSTGVATLGERRGELVGRLRSGLAGMPHVELFPLAAEDGRIGIVSFRIVGWEADEAGFVLRDSFGIEVRTGLHCAPLAIPAPYGVRSDSIRASFGLANTESDAHALLAAVAALGGR